MTKQEALDKIEELKKFVEQSDKKKGRFRAEANKSYWYVYHDGCVYEDTEDFIEIDDARWEIGNYYETKEQAKKEVARRKVIAKLGDLNEGFEPDWGNANQEKYFLGRSKGRNKWDTNSCFLHQSSFILPYFATTEAMEHAIDTLGDELDVLLD